MKMPGMPGMGGMGGAPKVSAPAMPSAPRPSSPKPKIKLRHIKLAGRSAFPQQPAAFGNPDQSAGPQAAFGADPSGPGPGDAGE